MSILSKAKSFAKKAYNTVKSAVSSVVKATSPKTSAVASVYSAAKNLVSTSKSSSTPKFTATVGQNVPSSISQSGNYSGFNAPSGTSKSGTNSSGGVGSASYGPSLPVTISGGKTSGSSKITVPQNYLTSSFNTSAFTGPITTSSLGGGGTTQGAVQGGGGSMGTGGTYASSPYSVPPQYSSTDPGNVNTTELAGGMAPYYPRKEDGTFDTTKLDQFGEKSDADIIREKAQAYKDVFGDPQSVYEDREVRQAQEDRRRAQEALLAPTAQLNAVLGQAQADTLRLRQTAQKEGVVEAVYGAQAAAINYNAAIAALPLQSHIAALQNNLELADSYLNELVTMKKEQIKSQYDYNKGLFDTIYSALDAKEKRIADAMIKENDRQYKDEDELIDYKAQLIAAINAQGDPNGHVRISAIERAKDKMSATKAAGNISSAGSAGKLEIKSVNGTDMLFNPATGAVSPISGGAVTPGAIDPVEKSLEQLSFLRSTASQASKLASASGASGIGKFLGDTFVGDTKYRQLEALTNTLKTNVLSLMTDPNIKKFFGPQMSNADVTLMTSAGTTLNPSSNTGAQMTNEIKRLDDLFNRMQTAVKLGSTSSMNVITAPTGEIIRITD